MTSRRTALSCRMCGAPGRLYLGGRLCPRHAPGGEDGEVMRPFPDYTGRIPQVVCDNERTTETGPGNAANAPGPSPQPLGGNL